MPFTTLIDTATLAASLSTNSFAIVDCRFNLADTAWGEREYAAGHIPGAVYAHLDRDLSGAKTGTNGRHPLPDPENLLDFFGRIGIERSTQVVAYDQDSGAWAARLWWLLRWVGHEQVAVLDGGFTRWAAEGRPIAHGIEGRAHRPFQGKPRPEMVVTASDVEQLLGRPDWKLLDARAPERFRGEVEPIDKAAGHIPGAANHHFMRNLNPDGTFLPSGTLRRALEPTVAGVAPNHVVAYCGSGVTACQSLLALEQAGLHGARLYAGSWSEWSSDPARPTAKGDTD